MSPANLAVINAQAHQIVNNVLLDLNSSATHVTIPPAPKDHTLMNQSWLVLLVRLGAILAPPLPNVLLVMLDLNSITTTATIQLALQPNSLMKPLCPVHLAKNPAVNALLALIAAPVKQDLSC